MDIRRLALGGVLLALGLAVGVVGVALVLRGFFSIDATVAVDGRPHVVEVGAGEHFLWVDTASADPTCEVDAGGAPLTLNPVAGEFTRARGTSDPWAARWWFDSPAQTVTLTCSGGDRSTRHAVEIGPRTEPLDLVLSLLALGGAAALLGLGGVVLLVVTVVRGLAPQSRPATT